MELKNLALFLMIMRKGGLSAAGKEMGLSPASVSERLAALEDFYGVSLIMRTTRSISLTDEGRIFADGARRLLSEADDLKNSVRASSQVIAGPIRLSTPVDLGQSRIIPILDSFLADYPAVTIDLDLTDGFIDLVSQDIDFAVRYGALADSTLQSKTIGENRRVLCASPQYLKQHGIPMHPTDLAKHDCIVMRFGTNLDRIWKFRVNGKLCDVKVQGKRVANNGNVVRQWCYEGQGICSKSIWDVQADLHSGRLVEILSEYSTVETALQIVYPFARTQPRRVRALIDFISDNLTSTTKI